MNSAMIATSIGYLKKTGGNDLMKTTDLNTQMNPEISRNITLLRYPAIVMVVMIHNVFEYAPLPVFCK